MSDSLIAEAVLLKRGAMLRHYHYKLKRHELEDAFGQACVEMVAHVRRGGTYNDLKHAINTLEQKFTSRITDRHRAINGRSKIEAALYRAANIAEPHEEDLAIEPIDLRAELEPLVADRELLGCVSSESTRLTEDQRLVIKSQTLDMTCSEFCRQFGWSAEKYRKVAQRGRSRLKELCQA